MSETRLPRLRVGGRGRERRQLEGCSFLEKAAVRRGGGGKSCPPLQPLPKSPGSQRTPALEDRAGPLPGEFLPPSALGPGTCAPLHPIPRQEPEGPRTTQAHPGQQSPGGRPISSLLMHLLEEPANPGSEPGPHLSGCRCTGGPWCQLQSLVLLSSPD